MNAMNQKTSDPREAIRDRIRAVGLRSTAPRVAVLELLESLTAPASHAEICEALEWTGFDRATLYRNLVDLTEAGLLSRDDLGDHVWRFSLRREEEESHEAAHPHFTCEDCGEVSCLPEVSVKVQKADRVPRSIAARAVRVQIRGRCDECA